MAGSDKKKPKKPQHKNPLKIVCISDTHSAEIPLPDGDLLLHAGDLTEKGTFDQIQAALDWLSSQPHEHKVIIAGNHDGLLDKKFVRNYPNQYPGETRGEADFDWGSLIYLKDKAVKLKFRNGRSVQVFGSPWVCEMRGFGVTPNEDIWKGKIPLGTDILLTHGPPYGHLDVTQKGHRGSKSLLRELSRARPKLVVFGHIHEGYGEDSLTVDKGETKKDATASTGIFDALLGLVFSPPKKMAPVKKPAKIRLINAAVPKVAGKRRNKPVVVQSF